MSTHYLTNGNDTYFAPQNTDDFVYADIGADTIGDLSYDGSNDEFWGQGGDDIIRSYFGDDKLYGGGGEDFLQVRAGRHNRTGGEGWANNHGFVIKVDGGADSDTVKIGNTDDGIVREDRPNGDVWFHVTVDGADDGYECIVKCHDIEKFTFE